MSVRSPDYTYDDGHRTPDCARDERDPEEINGEIKQRQVPEFVEVVSVPRHFRRCDTHFTCWDTRRRVVGWQWGGEGGERGGGGGWGGVLLGGVGGW